MCRVIGGVNISYRQGGGRRYKVGDVLRKVLLDAIRSGNTKKFYKSKEWRKKRKEIIRRDNKECQKCKDRGSYHKAETVHHIKYLKDHPELALVDSNLISLCNTCHNEEHPEKLEGYQEKKKRFMNEERWE